MLNPESCKLLKYNNCFKSPLTPQKWGEIQRVSPISKAETGVNAAIVSHFLCTSQCHIVLSLWNTILLPPLSDKAFMDLIYVILTAKFCLVGTRQRVPKIWHQIEQIVKALFLSFVVQGDILKPA